LALHQEAEHDQYALNEGQNVVYELRLDPRTGKTSAVNLKAA